MSAPTESSALLPSNRAHEENGSQKLATTSTRRIVWGALTILFFGGLAAFVGRQYILGNHGPQDPMDVALAIMEKAPVIVSSKKYAIWEYTHVLRTSHFLLGWAHCSSIPSPYSLQDLPYLTRIKLANNASAIDLTSSMPGHVDIARLKQGRVGGFFWSVYMECPGPEEQSEDFLKPTSSVRDTLEQIDVAKALIDKYPETFQLATDAADVKSAIRNGKIASLLGVEGAHQIGNSLAVLRQYHALGVSDLGRTLIAEMNRLGVLVDLSHTSDATAIEALKLSKAPVIWSHSSARAVHDVPRNVPDEVLRLVGTGEGQTDAVVMINFAPFFVAEPGEANVKTVAEHVEHVAKIAGKKHVGLGSDYDGIESVPVGLEDVSKYPGLIAELYARGWDKYELAGLTGGNFLRIFEGAEKVSKELKAAGQQPAYDLYEKREDIPRVEL
ncbi:hypothetical protein H0H92_002318 [Tricholoma furcatifolium]|nr:hypothetical protein H0H92_002318 [Tricholoma furcatifolium]